MSMSELEKGVISALECGEPSGRSSLPSESSNDGTNMGGSYIHEERKEEEEMDDDALR